MRLVGALAAIGALVPTSLASTPSLLGVAYICSAEQRERAPPAQGLAIMDGMGSGGFNARAGSPEAQAWLSYGLKLYHAFYHEDAKAAFARAVKLDPGCSLCASGEALGLGPTLNYTISEAETAKALDAARRASSLARSPFERDLAAILERRYAPGASGERERRYGLEMAALARRHAKEPDVAVLAAHALITPSRRGDFGQVQRAMTILEAVLARDPDNTAAIHYYIHASEFAGRPAVALPYAERLARLAPNASHLVHMAAHTLIHVGRYEDVAVVNAAALKVDADYASAMGEPGPLGSARYYAHNMMFGVFGALMAGDRHLSLKYADHARVAFPAGADRTRRGVVEARTFVAYGRYAPRRALSVPAPLADAPAFEPIYWRYGRGEALAALGDADGVLEESRQLAALAVPDGGGLPELKAVASKVLAGRAAMMKGDPGTAARLYAEAAEVQEKAAFAQVMDPPLWWYPVRRSVAAARLKAGDFRGAVADARASLAAWPADPLALHVLSEAQRGLGDRAGSRRAAAEASRVWRDDAAMPGVDLI